MIASLLHCVVLTHEASKSKKSLHKLRGKSNKNFDMHATNMHKFSSIVGTPFFWLSPAVCLSVRPIVQLLVRGHCQVGAVVDAIASLYDVVDVVVVVVSCLLLLLLLQLLLLLLLCCAAIAHLTS